MTGCPGFAPSCVCSRAERGAWSAPGITPACRSGASRISTNRAPHPRRTAASAAGIILGLLTSRSPRTAHRRAEDVFEDREHALRACIADPIEKGLGLPPEGNEPVIAQPGEML